MTTLGTFFYWGIICLMGMMAVVSLTAGWWYFTVAAVIVGGCFALTGPFVLGRRWRPAPPRPTRRPVVRRRR